MRRAYWRREWDRRFLGYGFVVLVFLVVSLWVVWLGFRVQDSQRGESLHVDGTLLKVGVNTKCGDSYCDLVGYRVDGKAYAGVFDLIGIDSNRVGTVVPLKVDPRNPDRADYRRTSPWADWGAAIAMVPICGLVLWFTSWSLGRRMRRRGVVR